MAHVLAPQVGGFLTTVLATASALTMGPPCPASVEPPIICGIAGRSLAPDEPDELPPAQPLAATGDNRFSLTGHCWVARN
jgi:hypothetical protein